MSVHSFYSRSAYVAVAMMACLLPSALAQPATVPPAAEINALVEQAMQNADAPTPSATPIAANAADAGIDQTRQHISDLQMRLDQLEQMLQAHRNLVNRNQMTSTLKLSNRLDAVENQLAGVPAGDLNAVSGGASADDIMAAQTRTRLNELEENLRGVRAQVEALMTQLNVIAQRQQAALDDNEFRFQQIETRLQRLQNGGVSLSEETQVLGRLKRPNPVPSAPLSDDRADSENAADSENSASGGTPSVAVTAVDEATKLVGEGDMPVPGQAVSTRPVLNDAQKLYDRALNALQQGEYGAAETDLRQMLADFPVHNLAGHAQYWLGETYYVRQDYKRAAETFLTGYTQYADSPKAPDSLLKLGITLNAIGQKKTGCDAFAELGAKFPDAPQAIVKRAEIEKRRAGCQS